jgi:phage-related protein
VESGRKIIVYKRYFLDFYEVQNETVQNKIEWTLKLIQTMKHVPEKYFKHLTAKDGLYEIRIEVGSNIYRIFSFFDKGNLIVLGNAFQKKSQKTPQQEILRAIKIMEEYKNEHK